MYNFFVADEVPVPSWRMTPPKDQAVIAALEKAISTLAMRSRPCCERCSPLRPSRRIRLARVASPAEMVAGLMRMVGEHRGEIKPGLFQISQEPKYMGMDLMNPPTVEGWHTGHEWIDSGTLVERINFACSTGADRSAGRQGHDRSSHGSRPTPVPRGVCGWMYRPGGLPQRHRQYPPIIG